MSTERVIVDEKVADEFAAKLAKRVAALPSGDPRKGDFVLGSVVGKPTVDRVLKLVKDAVAKGAKVLCSGTPPDADVAALGGRAQLELGVALRLVALIQL